MHPGLPQLNNSDRLITDPVISGNNGARSGVFSYVQNIPFRQLGLTSRLTFQRFVTTAIHHVLGVVKGSSREDVGRIDTRRIVAPVTHQNALGAPYSRRFPVSEFMRDAVSGSLLTVPTIPPMSASLVRGTHPGPALVRSANIDVAPKVQWLASAIRIPAMTITVVLLDHVRRDLELGRSAPRTQNPDTIRILTHATKPLLFPAVTAPLPGATGFFPASPVMPGALGAEGHQRRNCAGPAGPGEPAPPDCRNPALLVKS